MEGEADESTQQQNRFFHMRYKLRRGRGGLILEARERIDHSLIIKVYKEPTLFGLGRREREREKEVFAKARKGSLPLLHSKAYPRRLLLYSPAGRILR